MKSLHLIKPNYTLTERELANIYDKQRKRFYSFVRYKGIIYYYFDPDILFDVWDNDTYSALSYKLWLDAGKPMPDLSIITEINTPRRSIWNAPTRYKINEIFT